ncbi:MAG: acyl carrier protein [Clostridiales bacterium]|nr:acyl carrier protein [Clostridiales bacterium]
MATIDKVKELISQQLNKPIEEITEDKEVVKDLGADSLDVVEMLMSLEEEYDITVPEEDAVNIKTVGDIVKLIEKN